MPAASVTSTRPAHAPAPGRAVRLQATAAMIAALSVVGVLAAPAHAAPTPGSVQPPGTEGLAVSA